jgi:hypothetical protein
MDWIILTQQEAQVLFAEATGALGILVNYFGVRQVLSQTVDRGGHPLTVGEYAILDRALQNTAVSSLGTFGFVFVYEEYKKICRRYPDRHLDPSQAFGLDQYSDYQHLGQYGGSADLVRGCVAELLRARTVKGGNQEQCIRGGD